MGEVIELFDDDWWLARAWEAMKRRRNRRTRVIFVFLLAQWDIIDGELAEVEEEDDPNPA